jgi:TonB-linked SusC/RagA family outer membrane protein
MIFIKKKPPICVALKKFLLVLKLTVFTTIVFTFNVSATVYSQDKKLSLNITNTSIKEVLHQIESKTEFRFIYENDGTVNLDKKISIQVTNQSVESILDQIFSEGNINYLITENNLILINPKLAVNNSASEQSQQQSITIKGTVLDKENDPLAGASVIVKGTKAGTAADANGQYSIQVSDKNAILSFSYLGYTSQEVKVGDRHVVDVILLENLSELDEVVVIGYGVMKKIDLTGSVASANIEAFRESPNVSIVQSLQGSVPGLNVGQVREAGADPSITIRGQNSFSGDQAPLIVVDGIIYNAGIMNLNPADVKSIDILKDASSASIYGSRAANGVILVTTFSGEKTEVGKPIFNYSTSYAVQTPTNRLKPLKRNQWIARVRDAVWERAYLENSGYTEYNPDFDVTSIWVSEENKQGFRNGTDFDWWDAATQTGHTMNHHLSISGKNDWTTYYISSGITEQLGYIMNDGYTRWTGKINLENKILDWFKVGIQSNIASGNYDGMTPNMGDVMRMSPVTVPYDAEGNLIRQPMGQNVLNPFQPTEIDDYNRKMNLFGNLYADINVPFIKGLSYRMNYSHSYSMDKRFQTDPNAQNYQGSVKKYNASSYTWSLDHILTYDRTFNKIHKAQVTLVQGREDSEAESTDATNSVFTNLDLGYNKIEVGANPKVSSTAWDETSLYYMGRLHYGYKGKYLGTFTVRRDGFSGFGEGHKFAIFPSGAFAWVISEENFMQNHPLSIEYLKLRASYGETGKRTAGRYSTLARVSAETGNGYIYGDGGSVVVGQTITSMANNDLRWETTTGLNLGLDFSIIKNRISGNVEYYNTNTTNILYDRNLPIMTGFSSISANIGKIENQGVEFSINSNNIKTKNFRWDMTVNYSINRNTIKSIDGSDVDGDGKEDDHISNSLFIGKPLNVNYYYNITGIYQLGDPAIPAGKRPGQYIIQDVDESGTITADADRMIIGYKDPSYRFSLSNTFKYRNFSLFVFVNSIQGGKNYYMAQNDPGTAWGYQDATTNSNSVAWDYWTPANPNAKYAQLYYGTPVANAKYQQRSFIRLQDVSLSYQFKKSLLSKIGINNLKLYVSGKNLYTWTNWEGWDPETGQGWTGGGFPVLKAFTFGLDLSF